MKKITFILSLVLCFWLISCDKSSDIPNQSMHTKQHSGSMQQLTMLVEHAVSMMAQGAELKLQGDGHGDAMLKQSADLLRRAMSGPEMAAMHKGGQGQSAMMQHTHALGAAAFDLLDMMMSLQSEDAPANHMKLHHALDMAAQGAMLAASTGASRELTAFMQQHGAQMQQAALNIAGDKHADSSAYKQAVMKLLHILAA